MIWPELGLLVACILVGARIGGIGLCIVTGHRARLLHADLRDAAGPAAYHSGMILAVAANPDASTRSMNVRAVP